MYKRCLELFEDNYIHQKDSSDIILGDDSRNFTAPVMFDSNRIERVCDKIYYISDIHLEQKILNKFKTKAKDISVKKYIAQIINEMLDCDSLSNNNIYSITVLFGGDVCSVFEIAQFFYSEFMARLKKIAKKINLEESRIFVYSILGNHEFWSFSNMEECYKSYGELFSNLGIRFLNNKLAWLNRKRIFGRNILIVGGVGFAGGNSEFNAEKGIYRGAIDRNQEIDESKKWLELYRKALEIAEKENCVLIVFTHFPMLDWANDISMSTGCVYFWGHNHRNYLYHDDDNNIHVFADNQIGYNKSLIKLKEAYIYNRVNPFASYCDGYHEITSSAYLQFYSYMCEFIEGNGTVDRLIKTNDARFYMIKHDGYFGFFLVSPKGTYICSGGNIKKIGKKPDIAYYSDQFLNMVKAYIKIFSPYRNAQEQISEYVKSFGGDGEIHGSIIDIDFYNHIMLDPNTGTVTYYYSPLFGYVKTYENLLLLLENHNDVLACNYKALLKSDNDSLPITIDKEMGSEIIKIDIKNSLYSFSNRMNQIQRLFDKQILRDWNTNLLSNDDDLSRESMSIKSSNKNLLL